ncbi:MAG: ABC transporter permease [Cyclobacteriaceae bacterium]
MIKNYIRLAFRGIRKNKLYASLNILGLALGIAAFIFLQRYVTYEKSYDTFHQHHKNLYRVNYVAWQSGEKLINSATSVPRAGSFMKEKMPEVIESAKAYTLFGVMNKGDKKFRENKIYVAEPSFLKMFDFPLIHGDINNALNEPNQIVISESMAKKYFDKTDVVGEFLVFNSWFSFTVKVTGVAKDVPDNSHFKFDFLVSFKTLNNINQDSDGSIASEDSWDWNSFYTYVLLRDGTDPNDFDNKFDQLLQEERGKVFRENEQRDAFPLQPITNIHLYSNLEREADPEGQGDGKVVLFLSLISYFILIIAWINYINLSTARSIERAKEVGVRKTMGAYQKQLISQFLTETFVLNTIAFIMAILFVAGGIQLFNQLTDSTLSIGQVESIPFWIMITCIFLSGCILSGLYPAFVLSRYKPATVIKCRASGSISSNFLRKSLVVFQFGISVSLIAGTIIILEQLEFMKSGEKGFEDENVLVIKGPSVLEDEDEYPSTLQAFKNELMQSNIIQNITASSNIPGEEIVWTNEVKRHEQSEGQMRTVSFAGIDYDYFPTYGISVIAGRNFSRSHVSDTEAVILNKAAARVLGFTDYKKAINKKITMYGDPKTIVGIVDDFKHMSAKNTVSPIVFPLEIDNSYFFTLKLKSNNYQEKLHSIEASYNQFFPGNPFDHFILDTYFNRLYKGEEQFSSTFTLFSVFAIIIACLGLFGLVSFSALQRTKEIGIRKTLGANTSSILYILTKEFIILIAIANVIAWPIIYLVMNGWLDNFATRISIGIPVFIISGLLVILVALVTVGFKTLRTAKSNPIEALRYE